MFPHFLDGTEPGVLGVQRLAQRSLELQGGATPDAVPGARLAAVFLNPSLRTRASLEAACHVLGVHLMSLSPGSQAWKLEWRPGEVMDGEAAEHLADAVPVLSQYADLLAVRAFAGLRDPEEDRADPVLSAFARHASVPVLNMESALWHPLQGLADTATWMSHLGEELVGQPLTLTWAPHPRALPAAVPNQVLTQAALMGMQVTVGHPEGFDLDPQVVERARGLAQAHGGGVRVVHDPDEAVRGARVVYAKSWSGFSGYADRQAEAARRAELGHWRVTAERMASTDGAGFMHCLPVRRNVVVTDEVLDGPHSWAHEQAGLRLWSVAALLELLFAMKGEPWNA